MQTVGGELTHKGKRLLVTRYGSLQLSEVYYAKEAKHNIISVPKLVERGITLHLTKTEAYIEKHGVRIQLQSEQGLWAVHTKRPYIAASLRLGLGGKTDAGVWHERLGHPSDRQIKNMIDKRMIPKEAENRKGEECDICLRSKPNRRPVPKSPEKSGDIVVQIDCMPVGHQERGWNGEVGAYVYSSWESKSLRSTPSKMPRRRRPLRP